MRVLLLLALAAPLPAVAQDGSRPRLFSLPPGCTAYLTVQTTSCTLSHHFTCEGDPEGWQRRVDLDEGGVTYFGAIDSETQWMESVHVNSGISDVLAPDPADPASLSGLIATGLDTYDFRTISPEVGETRFVGQDRLTGNTVTIDGVTLDETEYNITAYDSGGGEMWRSEGREYISREYRMFLSGISTVTAGGESWDSNDTPVQFIFPGEDGFLSGSPTFGCGAVLSSLIVPLEDGDF